MNNFSQVLLKSLFLFFTLTITTISFSQENLPEVRKEDGGGNNGDCDINYESDASLVEFYVVIKDLADMDGCDLNVGYQLPGLDYETIALSNYYYNSSEDEYLFRFEILFPGVVIHNMCNGDINSIQFEILCEDANGNYVNYFSNGSLFDLLITKCCPDSDPTQMELPPRQNDGSNNGGGLKSNLDSENSTRNIEFEKKESNSDLKYLDYILYDLHGNQIKVLKNVDSTIPIQNYISNLVIQNGIYFVRYVEEGQIKTFKIYKH
ncbi:MAG: T9SS type A sorting domain-containing protein [Saprospiraceae bacterium]|nr:T9SS type A sorting domain-containing protein [Saprospiraceae bacterium]